MTGPQREPTSQEPQQKLRTCTPSKRERLHAARGAGYPTQEFSGKPKTASGHLKALSGATLLQVALSSDRNVKADVGVAVFHAALLENDDQSLIAASSKWSSMQSPTLTRSASNPAQRGVKQLTSSLAIQEQRLLERSKQTVDLGLPSYRASRNQTVPTARDAHQDAESQLTAFGIPITPSNTCKGKALQEKAASTMASEAFNSSMKSGLGLSFEGTLSSTRAIRGDSFVWVKGQVLGRGSLGTVYEGLDQSSGQMLAVKEIMIDSKNQADKKFQADMKNEIDIFKDLTHPHIVSYLGHDSLDDHLYIYLEYMSGGSVAQVLSQYGPFAEELVQLFAREILEGLEYLHTRKPSLILHRDIKGANILLGNGHVKLSDFGCSKKTADTLAQTMRGSIPWMAPEVVMSSGYGRRSDVWSFGCSVLEMLTAKLPWGGFDNPMAGMRRIGMTSDIPAVPENISGECKEFIHQCLIRDKTTRPLASSLLQHDFVQDVSASRTPDESLSTMIFNLSLAKPIAQIRDARGAVGH